MPAKLLGVALILAGLLLRHGVKRARQRGFLGPRHQRIHRAVDRVKFNVAIGTQVVGSLICFLGALLCFTHMVGHRW